MGEHTPTPWLYRPHKYDDWGWIRGQPEEGESVGPIIATARSGKYETPEQWDEHRRNKTDPFEANAAFIVSAVNSHDALVKALEFIRDGYANQDVNHVDYRVKVYQVALETLAKATS